MNKNKVVEVFQTNVEEALSADRIISLLLQHFPNSRVNFDLEDCDKILRVEGENICAEKITILIQNLGFVCAALN